MTDQKKQLGVTVFIDLNANQTAVGGTGSSWTDMAVLLEGLNLVCHRCIEDGMNPKVVYDEIKNYFMKIEADGGYKTILKHKGGER